MKIFLLIRTALKGIQRTPMRAMLTSLGIVIGVGAVIAMMEIGQGSSSAIREKIANMGANALIIIPGTAENAGVTHGAGSAMTLTPDDCKAIAAGCPSVGNAAPIVRARAQAVHNNANWVPDSVEGSTSAYLEVREWNVVRGRALTGRDVSSAKRVCLLGQTVACKLFNSQDPVGRKIRLRNVALTVVGLLEKKGANLVGQDQDDIILAPWTTIKYRIAGARLETTNQSSSGNDTGLYPGGRALYPEQSETQAKNTPMLVRFCNIDAVMAAAVSTDKITAAINEITSVLRTRHGIKPGQADDFQIVNLTEVIGTLSATSVLMTNLLLFVAAISLAVGGVGIMNIMLVSVTERTREIGLRMAVGGRPGDILWQFIVEAVALCLLGGIAGIIFGNSVTYLIWRFFNWPVQATPLSAAIAVFVSASVGIVFGFYPAWRASRLNPIEALRYE